MCSSLSRLSFGVRYEVRPKWEDKSARGIYHCLSLLRLLGDVTVCSTAYKLQRFGDIPTNECKDIRYHTRTIFMGKMCFLITTRILFKICACVYFYIFIQQ